MFLNYFLDENEITPYEIKLSLYETGRRRFPLSVFGFLK